MLRSLFKIKLVFFVVILCLIVTPFLILVFYVEGRFVWPILLGTSHLTVLLLFYFLYSNGLVMIEILLMRSE